METKKKSLNKKRLIILLAVLVVVLLATVFVLNIVGVRTRWQADSSAEVPVQSTDSTHRNESDKGRTRKIGSAHLQLFKNLISVFRVYTKPETVSDIIH